MTFSGSSGVFGVMDELYAPPSQTVRGKLKALFIFLIEQHNL